MSKEPSRASRPATKTAAQPAPTRQRRRKGSARKPPEWLETMQELDQMARRRCLLLLRVLSGETSVLAAAEEAGISAAQYYQMETKALRAMVGALVPGATETTDGTPLLAQLSKKLEQSERERRRLERQLALTRQLVKPGPMTTGRRGRPRLAALLDASSTASGSGPSPSSSPTATPPLLQRRRGRPPKTPKPDGAGARS